MLTTQVTQEQWRLVTGKNPSHYKKGGGKCPVENVSWDECQEFVKILNELEGSLSYRMPTEAEWEYSCRAGSQARYCYGDDEGRLEEYGWYKKNSGVKTQESKPAQEKSEQYV